MIMNRFEPPVPLTSRIHTRAAELSDAGVAAMDAFHVACAEAAHAHYFVTCDDDLVKKLARIKPRIVVMDPLDLAKELNL